jgi:dipeptidase E
LARLVKLLLTSAGLRNETLRQALRDLLQKPFASTNVVYVPTASVAEPGDHGWFVADLNRVYGLGWHEFHILEVGGLPRQMVLDRLMRADLIYVQGGNQYHLARSITGNGLADGFLEALQDRVYVGVSAGSMIFSRNLDERSAEVIGDTADLHVLAATTLEPPLGCSTGTSSRTWTRRTSRSATMPGPIGSSPERTSRSTSSTTRPPSASTATRWTSSPKAGGASTREGRRKDNLLWTGPRSDL